jgi:hypothetical protein
MKYTRIGSVETGDPGSDVYYLIKLNEDDDAKLDSLHPLGATPEQVESFVAGGFAMTTYIEGSVGQQFCHSTTLLSFPYDDRKFVGIQHVRWDV